MSGIASPVKDILAKLTTLQVTNRSNKTLPLFARVWNNQAKQLADGDISNLTLPAAYLEVQMPNEYNQLAMGITESDVTWRVHLFMEQLDTAEGTMDENLTIFDLRDAVIKLLTYFQPTACGNLQKINEEQDYEHTNLYHYIVDFKCGFIDDRGDQRAGQKQSVPPTPLDLIIAYEPVEILSLGLTADIHTGAISFVVDYRLLATQDVKVIISQNGVAVHTFDMGTITANEGGTFTTAPPLVLASGSYQLALQAVASSFTTLPWDFTV